MRRPWAVRRLLVWGGLILLSAGLTVEVRRRASEARFEQARAELLAGRVETAREAFEELQASSFVGARARAGATLARALVGQDAGRPDVREGFASFPFETLLDLARRSRGEPLAARRAVARLLDGLGERLAALDLAALELDAGDDAAARRRSATDPAAFASRGLGREVTSVLEQRADGAAAIVRDRKGRRLGRLESTGGLTLEADVPPALVPEAARAALAARFQDEPKAAGWRLALDLDLSDLARNALGFTRGSIVLLDPHTGGVLAAVSDPVTRAASPGGTPAFEDRREPASISKLITAAAGLRAGLDLDDVLRRLECRGSERFGNGIVWCSSVAGRLEGLDQAMALSCNLAFAHIGAMVGREALLAELHLWGFDHDFAQAPAGRVRVAAGDARQLADLSIGLEATDITPLHGALMAAVIAHDGQMPEPFLVEGSEGPMGLVTRPLPVLPPREVIPETAVPVLARSMQAVAVYGTAAGVAPPGFPVAMKTGTGAEWRKGYHVNYVGVAPWPNPVVAFGVRVTHEPTSSRVNRAAREVLRPLLEGLKRRESSLRERAP